MCARLDRFYFSSLAFNYFCLFHRPEENSLKLPISSGEPRFAFCSLSALLGPTEASASLPLRGPEPGAQYLLSGWQQVKVKPTAARWLIATCRLSLFAFVVLFVVVAVFFLASFYPLVVATYFADLSNFFGERWALLFPIFLFSLLAAAPKVLVSAVVWALREWVARCCDITKQHYN